MPSSDLYATDAEVRDYLRASDPGVSVDDDIFALELEGACREIDRRCGRLFWQPIDSDDTPTARTYHADRCDLVRVDDFWTTTGLVVKTDDAGNGTYGTTWTIGTDFVVEPDGGLVDGLTGFPYWRLVAVGPRSFPTAGNRRRVQVTASWGWPSIPPAIKRATLVATAAHLKVRDAPHGVAGFGEFGALRIPPDVLRTIEGAIGPYKRMDRVGGIG